MVGCLFYGRVSAFFTVGSLLVERLPGLPRQRYRSVLWSSAARLAPVDGGNCRALRPALPLLLLVSYWLLARGFPKRDDGGKKKTQVDLTHLERLHRRRVPRGDGLEPLLAREARRGGRRRVAPGRAEVRLARGRVGDVGQDGIRLRQLLP